MSVRPLDEPARRRLRRRLEHPFDLIMEAVEYRLGEIREHEVRLYTLVPEAEYSRIRIFVSDLDKVREFIAGRAPVLAYVSFVGEQRPGMGETIETIDRALIESSPAGSPIVGYFSLQDPQLDWVNLVLFDDLESLSAWLGATDHASDWATAAAMFTRVEKSIGQVRCVGRRVTIEPRRLVERFYDAPAGIGEASLPHR